MAEPTSPLTRTATEALLRLLEGPPSPEQLAAALRHLTKWRAAVLENTLVQRSGTQVLSGPFAGMAYAVRAAEGSRSARLLGCYEASLAPVIEAIIARAYPLVIDIGAAEGYYAVGLARRMPGTIVMACDSNPSARALCHALAEANGVADRLRVEVEMTHAGLDICAAQPTVILCDIEGAEAALLDPVRAPGLLAADILVEVHEGRAPGLPARLAARFDATHHISRIDRTVRSDALPDWAEELSDLDRLILLWEWRSHPTPWLWMERK
jgi:hypothetical protein